MVQDIVMAYQLIARHAAEGKDLDQFLRMMHDAHGMLQPEKDEAGEGRAPIPARFVLDPHTPELQPEGAEAPTAASSKPQPGAQSRCVAAGDRDERRKSLRVKRRCIACGGRGHREAGQSKLSRMVSEALRYLGTVRNYAPATPDRCLASR
jgi:hypothetical protein